MLGGFTQKQSTQALLDEMRASVETLHPNSDRVAVRVTMRGTHRGAFQRIAPTVKRGEVRAIDMFRISGGKIVEHWGHADDPSGYLRQSQCP